MSKIVASFVDLAVPSLERVVLLMERAKTAPEEVRAGLSAALDRADRDLIPSLMEGIDQADLFLVDALSEAGKGDAGGTPLAGGSCAAAATTKKRAPKAGKPLLTPHQ